MVAQSGRVTAFCPSGPGSNPGGTQGWNTGFFVSDVVNLFLLGEGIDSDQFREMNQFSIFYLQHCLSIIIWEKIIPQNVEN